MSLNAYNTTIADRALVVIRRDRRPRGELLVKEEYLCAKEFLVVIAGIIEYFSNNTDDARLSIRLNKHTSERKDLVAAKSRELENELERYKATFKTNSNLP